MYVATPFKKGLLEAIPISISTFLFSAIFGIVAVQEGYSTIESTLFSAISFSGAAQLSILPIMHEVSLWTVFGMTFLLNIRHLLYGLTLAPHVQDCSERRKSVIAFLLCDSLFAVATQQLRKSPPSTNYWIGAGITIYVAWCIGTWFGASFTSFLPNGQTYGLDIAGTACFVILLAGELKTRTHFLTAFLCTLFVLLFTFHIQAGLLLIAAGAIAFTIGYFSKEGELS